MSKFLKLLCITILGLGFLSTSAFADAGKGQKLFIKELKGPCGFDGGTMAKKHKQAEWKAIQESGKLNDEIKKFCPNRLRALCWLSWFKFFFMDIRHQKE